MHNHEPADYRCPLCAVINGIEGDFPQTKQADIIYRDETIIAFIASGWWPNNKGHVMVVPLAHIEALYDMPDATLGAIHAFSKRLAVALKETYGCDGVSVRQHNEPAGNQDVWHYHLHVFPRYENDDLYTGYRAGTVSDPAERIPYGEKLRAYFEAQK